MTVHFSETSPGTYFKDTQTSHGTFTRDDLTTAATSLLNIGALTAVDASTSQKVLLLWLPKISLQSIKSGCCSLAWEDYLHILRYATTEQLCRPECGSESVTNVSKIAGR